MYKIYEKLRNERGLTNYAVASKTGIPESSLYDWEQRSRKNPRAAMSFDAIAKIADLFDVSMDVFKGEEVKV